jgi:hypothetical protein
MPSYEIPWSGSACALCLASDKPFDEAHLFPAAVGGFVWSRAQCRACNNEQGNRVEARVKSDPAIRYAVETALADSLPASVIERFRRSQPYVHRAEHGSVQGVYKKGDYRIVPSRHPDGSWSEERERARESVKKQLSRREGMTPEQIQDALDRFEAAPPGELTLIAPDVAVKHGSVPRWDLPWDGKTVSDLFPAGIAFHWLALQLGKPILHPMFNPYREAVRTFDLGDRVIVESGLSRRGYAPTLAVGTEQWAPHVVIRVELFGEITWRVHYTRFAYTQSRIPLGVLISDVETAKVRWEPLGERVSPVSVPNPASG